jgi:prepilin-type N-terminal cleavage/methylation domain-containing protein
MRCARNREQGFSLIETLIVVGVMAVLMGMALINTSGTLKDYKANSAVDTVVSQLRQARQTAISQRRYVQLTIDQSFSGLAKVQHISFAVLAAFDGGAPPAAQVAEFPPATQMMGPGGVTDTPMGFGTCGAVCIAGTSGGPPTIMFNSSGGFTDGANNPVNGTIFIGMAGAANPVRAVTIMGGTGRIRAYRWTGTQWVE